eukprot:2153947-Amphidinium_carterae.1
MAGLRARTTKPQCQSIAAVVQAWFAIASANGCLGLKFVVMRSCKGRDMYVAPSRGFEGLCMCSDSA